MTSMLNTLLDINQIEVGAVKVEALDFHVKEILTGLRRTYLDCAGGRPRAECGALPSHDPKRSAPAGANDPKPSLERAEIHQRGRVTIGCRRRPGHLRIEIWDTGLGIPEAELGAIFEEYHQVNNPARQRSRGLGLGLSIVKSLGDLLGHPIRVRSRLGKGSVFSIEVPLAIPGDAILTAPPPPRR